MSSHASDPPPRIARRPPSHIREVRSFPCILSWVFGVSPLPTALLSRYYFAEPCMTHSLCFADRIGLSCPRSIVLNQATRHPECTTPIVRSDYVFLPIALWCGGRGTLGRLPKTLRSAAKYLLIAQFNSPLCPSWIALNLVHLAQSTVAHSGRRVAVVPLLIVCAGL